MVCDYPSMSVDAVDAVGALVIYPEPAQFTYCLQTNAGHCATQW